MLRIVALITLILCALPRGYAQQGVYINSESDTLHYTYTPFVETGQLQPKPHAEKKPFFKRVMDYFSTKDRTFEKKIDLTFAGGPNYSKNTNFGIGAMMSGLYRLDRTDSITPPSDISLFATISVIGVYSLEVSGNNIFPHNSKRIDYFVRFSSTPTEMWGIGYDAGRYNEELSYTEKLLRIRGRYLHRVLPSFYVGGMVDFRHTKAKRFDEAWLERIHNQRASYTATGIGAVLEYDSRDFIPNPFKGLYLGLEETIFPKGLGNAGHTLWRTSFTARYYGQLWHGGILATDLYAEINSKGTPWSMLARMGGSYRMRGYFEGRYADRNMATFQVELRQRIWRRFGGVAWGGAGNVFGTQSFDWSHTLPNYGLGLRFEIKQRVNIRLDYGMGKQTSGFLLSINEAF